MRLLLALLTVFLSIIAVWLVLTLGRRGSRSKAPFSGRCGRKDSMKTSNLILLVMGLCTLAFVVTMIVIFCVKGSIPDTLVQCFFSGGGVEALLLAGIKISKVVAGNKPVENVSESDTEI